MNQPCLMHVHTYHRADSRFVPSQWGTALLCNEVSHWLGANLESALISPTLPRPMQRKQRVRPMPKHVWHGWNRKIKHEYSVRWLVIVLMNRKGLISSKYNQSCVSITRSNIDGLVQERRNSIANAPELRLSSCNPPILQCYTKYDKDKRMSTYILSWWPKIHIKIYTN